MRHYKTRFLQISQSCKNNRICIYASTYIIADKFDIPLIIQGENPGLTLGTRLTGVGTDSNCNEMLKNYRLYLLVGKNI